MNDGQDSRPESRVLSPPPIWLSFSQAFPVQSAQHSVCSAVPLYRGRARAEQAGVRRVRVHSFHRLMSTRPPALLLWSTLHTHHSLSQAQPVLCAFPPHPSPLPAPFPRAHRQAAFLPAALAIYSTWHARAGGRVLATAQGTAAQRRRRRFQKDGGAAGGAIDRRPLRTRLCWESVCTLATISFALCCCVAHAMGAGRGRKGIQLARSARQDRQRAALSSVLAGSAAVDWTGERQQRTANKRSRE